MLALVFSPCHNAPILSKYINLKVGMNMGKLHLLAVEELYCNSNGAFELIHVWNGEEIIIHHSRDGFNINSAINATPEIKAIASEWYQLNVKDTRKHTYIGCTVILARSRKAPNKIPLKVLDFIEGGYDSRYNQYIDDKITVLHDDGHITINASCIKEVILGAAPYWAA